MTEQEFLPVDWSFRHAWAKSVTITWDAYEKLNLRKEFSVAVSV